MRVALFTAFWVLSGTAFGQQLTAKWNVDSMRIGERAVLTIQFRHAPKTLKYQSYSGVIPCEIRVDSSALTQDGELEIVGSFSDSTYKKNGIPIWEGHYTITAWDTGVYVFPRIFVDPGKGDTIYNVQPEPLTVSFVKKKIDDDIDEVPIEVETETFRWLKTWWWLGLIPIAMLVVLLIRRKNSRAPARVLSLKERTQIALDALRKQAYWKKGRIEEHYVEFSFILRSFLSARYELNLMERTTYETLLLLRAKDVPEQTLERIRRLLQESDIVKFGMGVPDEESILLGMNYLGQLIVELSPLELIER